MVLNIPSLTDDISILPLKNYLHDCLNDVAIVTFPESENIRRLDSIRRPLSKSEISSLGFNHLQIRIICV